MTQNQKIFRRIVIALILVCIFLVGSVINIDFSKELSIKLATMLFIVMIAFVAGLFIGYTLGGGKNFFSWKDNSNKK